MNLGVIQSGAARIIAGLASWLVLSFAAAAIGGYFTPGEWYAALRKPAWNPPNWIFAPVWTVLYASMGVASWLVWRRGGFAKQRRALSAFLLQLALNAAWSPLFFGLKNPALALVDIVLLWCAVLVTVIQFWKVRPLPGVLLIPYLAWISFATALNFAVWTLNPTP